MRYGGLYTGLYTASSEVSYGGLYEGVVYIGSSEVQGCMRGLCIGSSEVRRFV